MAMRPQIATDDARSPKRARPEILVSSGRCSSRIPRTRSSSDQWRDHIEVAPRTRHPGTADSKAQEGLAVGRAVHHRNRIVVAHLFPHAIQHAVEQVHERMEPEHAREKLLENHHAMVASREVRGLVAEDRQQFVLAQSPGPSRRQQHIVADDARRDGGGDFCAFQANAAGAASEFAVESARAWPELDRRRRDVRRATIRRRRSSEQARARSP